MSVGTVKWFTAQKRFGFILPGRQGNVSAVKLRQA
jgi:cold shock CspA family protein